jgi:signal transduction histidine kinase
LPVFDLRQHIMAVAFAALNLNWMNQPVFSQLSQLPKDSRLTLLETDQGVLRYDANSRQWSIPEAFDPELRSAIFARRSGILSAPDEDKILRIYAFAPIASALRKRDTMVVLEIPQKVALAASRRVFTRNVILVAASALIAILSIWWASNALILRRVQAMVQVSHKLSAGDLSARIGQIGGQDELSHLARVFDEMAASIQQRIEREASVTASLERSHEQLRRLSAYQQEVRELERTRIAREIHDQFGQSLTILKMDLSRLKKQLPAHLSAVNEKIEAMARVIDDAIQILHTVTADLRPVILDDFGLAAAIEWQAELFQQRTGIGCRLENNGFEPELPKDQATALFRIFQECLTNVVRHAQADDVVVRLEARPGELMLQIKDNGRGITNAEINAPDAFGLLGIRERLYPWNGRTTFSGRPGQGTQVTIYLPMLPEGGSQ